MSPIHIPCKNSTHIFLWPLRGTQYVQRHVYSDAPLFRMGEPRAFQLQKVMPSDMTSAPKIPPQRVSPTGKVFRELKVARAATSPLIQYIERVLLCKKVCC